MTKNLFTIVTYCHIVDPTVRLNYAQEEDSKWEQMIYLWRALILKLNLERNEHIGQPPDINEVLSFTPMQEKRQSANI